MIETANPQFLIPLAIVLWIIAGIVVYRTNRKK